MNYFDECSGFYETDAHRSLNHFNDSNLARNNMPVHRIRWRIHSVFCIRTNLIHILKSMSMTISIRAKAKETCSILISNIESKQICIAWWLVCAFVCGLSAAYVSKCPLDLPRIRCSSWSTKHHYSIFRRQFLDNIYRQFSLEGGIDSPHLGQVKKTNS